MTDPGLRHAVRLHLAPLTPLQRTGLARGAPSPEAARSLASVGEADVDAELERCRARGLRLVTSEDPRWPPLLRQMPDPPLVLWVRGTLPDPSSPALAVVGPRRPSPYGLTMALHLARDVARAGGVVVSGGARGVDAQAHQSALDAGRPTVAVLGCGADVPYPPENADLFARIAAEGALVSEHPCGTPPLRHHFPVRNRLLAGWAAAVLVIEATFKSGSLITARLALDQDREVLAVPGPVTSRLSEGTNDLLARGARVLRGLADVIDALDPDARAHLAPPETVAAGAAPGAAQDTAGAFRGGDPVLAALPAGEARAVDDLAEATGLEAGALLARLVVLEAAGAARSLPGGLWLRVPAPAANPSRPPRKKVRAAGPP